MALVADANRPKRDRRNAIMLFNAIQQEGFTGCYSRVTEFVRNWRNCQPPVPSRHLYHYTLP